MIREPEKRTKRRQQSRGAHLYLYLQWPKITCTRYAPLKQRKIAILGESGTGKTSLCQRLSTGVFQHDTGPTVGAAYLIHHIAVPDYGTVRLDIWDTAGQDRYHSLAPMYYRGCPGVIVVYDITDNNSFQKAAHWVDELRREATPDVVIMLAGNKLDMESKRQVELSTAMGYVEEANLCGCIETSAKNGDNVQQLFAEIAARLVAQTGDDAPVEPHFIDLIDPDEGHSSKCRC